MKISKTNRKLTIEVGFNPRKELLLLRRLILHARLRRLHRKWKKVTRSLWKYSEVPPISDWTWKGDKTYKNNPIDITFEQEGPEWVHKDFLR